MLKVENLIKKYGDFEVLKGISFEVSKGCIYGFLGKNGTGKTTTMNILTGLINYNSGNIFINGKDFNTNKRQLLKTIGYLPQAPVFYGYMTGYEYLKFIGSLSGMSPKEVSIRADEVLEIVQLKSAAKRKLSGYSGGMKQRFGLAVALFNHPEILFLDEPTSALDPEGRMEVLSLIEKLKAEGITVFLSSHILNDIERVCDEVSILDKGKILISDNLKELEKKYIQPIFDVEVEGDISTLTETLFRQPLIENIKSSNNLLSIYVKNIDEGKKQLLKLILATDCTVLSYNIRKSNLEDIFMRMVIKE
ncbi:ABC-type multidrug transport system, ATPase component [Clostridium pasteurianum BC1]|uniref:ABC-type multidrug transport system, ATPase component n=1 Tax=Clostridium pasteurianum BC1 TaxID=86416 RepID=R4JZT4_CLOPA|nr:ABC transporter ATP-binding protein [Clostridium pasteurianum]AGK96352.1 ABC-type multidrug transport system, ATPase component [Clostridium pasteurianum BC1]